MAAEYSDHIEQIVHRHSYRVGANGEEITEAWKAYRLKVGDGNLGIPPSTEDVNSSNLFGDSGNAEGGYPDANGINYNLYGITGEVNGKTGLCASNDQGAGDPAEPDANVDALRACADAWGLWRGRPHPLYGDLYLDEYTATPIGNAVANQADIVGTFRSLGLPDDTPIQTETPAPISPGDPNPAPPTPIKTPLGYRWLVSYRSTNNVALVKTNFDKDGKLMIVNFMPPKVGNPPVDNPWAPNSVPNNAPAVGQNLCQYGEAIGLESIVVMEWDYNEISSSIDASGDWINNVDDTVRNMNGRLNRYAILGCDPYTLRTRVIAQEVNPRRCMMIPDPETGELRMLRRVKYVVEYRQRGWREVLMYRFPQTGFPPSGIADPTTHIVDPLSGQSLNNPPGSADFSVLPGYHPAVFSQPWSHDPITNLPVAPIPGVPANADNGWILVQAILDIDFNLLGLRDMSNQ